MNNFTTLVDSVIQAEMYGNPSHELILHLGPTPSKLVQYAGFPALDLAILAKTIGKAHFDHGICKTLLKRLPAILDDPKCIFRSANQTQRDSVVVLTFEAHGGSPVIVPIRQNQGIGRGKNYNVITSVYGKDGPDPEVKWKSGGLLLWEK